MWNSGLNGGSRSLAGLDGLNSLQRRFIILRLNHRRTVMHDHQPPLPGALEHVGGQHLRPRDPLVTALGKVFLHDYDREVAADHHIHLAKLELHLEGTFENPLPAGHYGSPSEQLAPSGMNAHDALILEPDRFHLSNVETFEGVVKGAIRRDHCLAI